MTEREERGRKGREGAREAVSRAGSASAVERRRACVRVLAITAEKEGECACADDVCFVSRHSLSRVARVVSQRGTERNREIEIERIRIQSDRQQGVRQREREKLRGTERHADRQTE